VVMWAYVNRRRQAAKLVGGFAKTAIIKYKEAYAGFSGYIVQRRRT